jgi:hypothetical protein
LWREVASTNVAGNYCCKYLHSHCVQRDGIAYRKSIQPKLERSTYEPVLLGVILVKPENLDISELFKEASKKAIDDIKLADQKRWGYLDKTWWHWLGGMLHFFWILIGEIIYYGSAHLGGYYMEILDGSQRPRTKVIKFLDMYLTVATVVYDGVTASPYQENDHGQVYFAHSSRRY